MNTNYDEDNENAPIGRCAYCGELIFDGDTKFYIDDDENYFCCTHCALSFYNIRKSEEAYDECD